MAIASKSEITILRPSNIYGPWQNPDGEAGVVSIFANKMIKKENQQIREQQSKKIKQDVNFKITGQNRISYNDTDGIELIEQRKPNRDRLATI